MRLSDGDAVSFGNFVRVAWAHDENVRHSAKRSELFDGLVRGTVFAKADGVVRENENDGYLHQGRETNSGLVVIAEIKEGSTEGTQASESHSAHGRAHGVF